MTGSGDETAAGDQAAAAPGGRGRLRASSADREHAIDALKAAFVQGRLDKDELDARAGQAFTSRTYAELAALTADLPAEPAAAPPRAPAQAQVRPQVQARPRVRKSIKTGAGAIILIVVMEALRLGATLPETAAMVAAGLVFGVVVAAVVALPIAGVLKIESRHRKRSGQMSRIAGS
jgi:DUF1707 SHOCT-like domain